MNFKKFLETFASTWGAATAAVTAGPLALYIFGACPPLTEADDGKIVAGFATVAGIVGITLAFYQHATIARLRRRGILGLGFALVPALVIALLWSSVLLTRTQVVDGVRTAHLVVTGFVLRPEYQDDSPQQALEFGGLNAWEDWSLIAARFFLVGAFMALAFLLAYGFGTLQSLAARRRED